MRVATLAVLTVLIALPADAVQQSRQHVSLATPCDNDGRCTTLGAAAPAPSEIRSETKATVPAPQHQSRALDANGNPPES